MSSLRRWSGGSGERWCGREGGPLGGVRWTDQFLYFGVSAISETCASPLGDDEYFYRHIKENTKKSIYFCACTSIYFSIFFIYFPKAKKLCSRRSSLR